MEDDFLELASTLRKSRNCKKMYESDYTRGEKVVICNFDESKKHRKDLFYI